MTLDSYRKYVREGIETKISHIASEYKKSLGMNDPVSDFTLNAVISSAIKGKLNRALLFYIGTESTRDFTDSSLSIACALEIIQTSYLVQDDVSDNDRMRRGEPSVFVQLEQMLSKTTQQADTLSKHCTYWIGDAGFHIASALLSKHASTDIQSVILNECIHTDMGQIQDLIYSQSTTFPESSLIIQMYKNKTGRYSIGLPLVCGLSYIQSSQQNKNLAWEFSDILGFIFQVTDDELNCTGSQNHTGKPVGSDIREGKKTYHLTHLYARATSQDKKTLSALYQKNIRTDDDINTILQMMHSYGISDHIKKQLNIESDRAMKIIDTMNINYKSKQFLQEFSQSLVTRTK